MNTAKTRFQGRVCLVSYRKLMACAGGIGMLLIFAVGGWAAHVDGLDVAGLARPVPVGREQARAPIRA